MAVVLFRKAGNVLTVELAGRLMGLHCYCVAGKAAGASKPLGGLQRVAAMVPEW